MWLRSIYIAGKRHSRAFRIAVFSSAVDSARDGVELNVGPAFELEVGSDPALWINEQAHAPVPDEATVALR
jgi:hypothetical protein